jgi:hypothetical protein
MVFKSKLPYVIFILLVFSLIFTAFYLKKEDPKPVNEPEVAISPSPKPPITTITVNGKTKVKYPDDYVLVFVGDSMTETLGNFDELRQLLSKYYPDKSFELLNYGFGSTNILSLEKRLTEKTQHGREFRPITEIDFDLIFIESFGHNPLSEFPLQEGLRKQTQSLEKALQILKAENPEAKIVFIATLAPSRVKYAEGSVNLTPEQRKQWVEERISYIKNHIKFAQDNKIPIINVFDASLGLDGDVDIKYINPDGFIHPSFEGVSFINRQIGEFLYESKILDETNN